MGLLEHYVPSVAHVIPGFMGDPNPIIADGFKRARFSFYGHPIAVFICAMALPLSLAAWRWWPSPQKRSLILAGAAVQLAAIYISGYRSIWLLLALQFAVLVIVRKKYWLGIVALVLALASYQVLPEVTRHRIQSLVRVLEGRPEETDTSGQHRWHRAMEAFHWALDDPAGHGWAASGWVHSDFIQVAANQGLVPAILFLGAYLIALGRLGKWSRSPDLTPELETLQLPLLLSFVAVGGILLYEGVQFLPQTILPVWLMWSLVEVWLAQASRTPRTKPRAGRRFSRISRTPALIQRVRSKASLVGLRR